MARMMISTTRQIFLTECYALPLIIVIPTELLIFNRKCQKILLSRHDDDDEGCHFFAHVNAKDGKYVGGDGNEENLI